MGTINESVDTARPDPPDRRRPDDRYLSVIGPVWSGHVWGWSGAVTAARVHVHFWAPIVQRNTGQAGGK